MYRQPFHQIITAARGAGCRWCQVVRYGRQRPSAKPLAVWGEDLPHADSVWPQAQRALVERAGLGALTIHRAFDWGIVHSGIMRLPFYDRPTYDMLAAIPLYRDAAVCDVLWMAFENPPSEIDTAQLIGRLQRRTMPRILFTPRYKQQRTEVLARLSIGHREQVAHALRGRVSTRLLMLWMKLRSEEAQQHPKDAEWLDALASEIEALRSEEVEPLARALYPVHVHWSLISGFRSVAESSGIHLAIGDGLKALDNPLANPMPAWFRVLALEVFDLACQEAGATGSAIARTRVDVHPKARLHMRFALHPGSQMPLTSIKSWQAVAVARQLGGVAHQDHHRGYGFHICIPFPKT